MTLQRVAQTVGAPSESCRMLTAYLPGATPSSCDSAEYPAFPAASESTDRATSARARPPSARSAYAFSVPSKTTATEAGDRLSGVTANPETLTLARTSDVEGREGSERVALGGG